jgi:hypothetical protein
LGQIKANYKCIKLMDIWIIAVSETPLLHRLLLKNVVKVSASDTNFKYKIFAKLHMLVITFSNMIFSISNTENSKMHRN